ncbi:hypothetical protein ACEPAI_7486 [Sanghuangporus weigelae]
MPVTRSASRQSSAAASANDQPLAKGRRTKANQEEGVGVLKEETSKSKKNTTKKASTRVNKKSQAEGNGTANGAVANLVIVPVTVTEAPQALLPAVLSFSLDDAKRHLIAADPRFEDLFSRLKCRPFEHLERVDPFRTLATSILGQQISWLAARSITHRFTRLFDPSLPEKAPETGSSSHNSFFPSAHHVAVQDVAVLRTAGLSGRKAEYVQDLAARFADGRLSNEKIIHASDEELYEMLTAVRGIGKQFEVDMFAIFSLRRPDIMPVGDLGVQRGVVRWFLSLHSPKHAYSISPRKLPTPQTDSKDVSEDNGQSDENPDIALPDLGEPARAVTPDAAPFPPAPIPSTPVTPVKGRKRTNNAVNSDDVEDAEVPMPPPAFTPSINRTLNKVLPTKYHPSPLPEGLSVKELQSRLEGKKKIKGAILTPKEMEDLTESWRPYRSLGVYYMWALAEGDKS